MSSTYKNASQDDPDLIKREKKNYKCYTKSEADQKVEYTNSGSFDPTNQCKSKYVILTQVKQAEVVTDPIVDDDKTQEETDNSTDSDTKSVEEEA